MSHRTVQYRGLEEKIPFLATPRGRIDLYRCCPIFPNEWRWMCDATLAQITLLDLLILFFSYNPGECCFRLYWCSSSGGTQSKPRKILIVILSPGSCCFLVFEKKKTHNELQTLLSTPASMLYHKYSSYYPSKWIKRIFLNVCDFAPQQNKS